MKSRPGTGKPLTHFKTYWFLIDASSDFKPLEKIGKSRKRYIRKKSQTKKLSEVGKVFCNMINALDIVLKCAFLSTIPIKDS